VKASDLKFNSKYFGPPIFFGIGQKKILMSFILAVLGTVVWSQRIKTSSGFLMDDCNHLAYSYANDLKISPLFYLPGVSVHRSIGNDAFTLLLRLFGERDIPFVWTLLFVHIASAIFIWLAIVRLTSNSLASLAGAICFLLSECAYLTIYWPGAIFDLLSTFFLASLLLSVTHIVRPRGEYRPWLLILTLPLLVAAIKTKESTIVVALPLFLLVFFGRLRWEAATKSPFVGAIIERFKQISIWEWVWYAGSTILVIALALTVGTDFGVRKDASDQYYAEYSLPVIVRSFTFFLSTLAFQSEHYQIGINPLPTALVMLAPLMIGLLLRNPWILLGWLWFVLFLLPLAALKNHYMNIYYPYPANIGLALFVAACFSEVTCAVSKAKLKSIRCFAYAFPIIFVALVVHQCNFWVKNSSIPQWYEEYHTRSAHLMEALRVTLPMPPPYAKIVLVIPEQTQFDHAPKKVLNIMYHDFTLDGTLFKELPQAREYLDKAASRSENVFLAIWEGNAFDVKYVTYH